MYSYFCRKTVPAETNEANTKWINFRNCKRQMMLLKLYFNYLKKEGNGIKYHDPIQKRVEVVQDSPMVCIHDLTLKSDSYMY